MDLSDLNVIVIRYMMFASVIGCGNAYEERGTVALRSLGVIAGAELRRPNHGCFALEIRFEMEIGITLLRN